MRRYPMANGYLYSLLMRSLKYYVIAGLDRLVLA